VTGYLIWRSVIEVLSNQVGNELAVEQNLHLSRNLREPEGIRTDRFAVRASPRDRSALWQFSHAAKSGSTSSISPASLSGNRLSQPRRRWRRTPRIKDGVNSNRAITT
jgi:hypothetical protein